MAKEYRCKFCKIKISEANMAKLVGKGKIKKFCRSGGPICPRCDNVCMDPDCSGYATKRNIERIKKALK